MKRYVNKYVISAVSVLGSIAVGAIVSDIKTMWDVVSVPMVWLFVELKPETASPDLLKTAYTFLCIFIYFFILLGVFSFIESLWYHWRIKEKDPEYLLYINEIAATVDLISSPDVTEMEIENALDDLMRKVGVNIADCFNTIPHKDLRYAFIMYQNEELVMLRVGKQMSLTEDDAKITDWVLANFDETHVLETLPEGMLPNSNVEAVGLVRNAGVDFRFGFVILIPDKRALTEKAIQRFYSTSSSVPLILYIDKLMNNVVKYSIKLKGGRG